MSTLSYLDFDLQIDEVTAGSYHARILTSPVGQAEAGFALPFSDLEIENFFLRIGRPRRGVRRINSPEMNEARKFGGKLYDALFQGGLQSCLLRSLDYAAQQEQGIRLRLRLPPSLIELPWEYLYDTTHQRFLAHSTSTPIVRYLDLPQSPKPLTISPPLKLLVMIASPSDYEALDVEAEWHKIQTALAGLEQRGLLQLTRLPAKAQQRATLAALQRELRQEAYHIFHFIGHGGFDQQTEDGVLLLESEEGRSRFVSGNDLGTLLHDAPSLRLAILNACEGARTTKSDPFAGVAQQLVRQGIPAVIAMQFEITDKAAIQLAREFYDALVSGYPVDGALAEARKALFTAQNDIEWGTPVLYLRATDGRLFDVTAQPLRPTTAVPPSAVSNEQPRTHPGKKAWWQRGWGVLLLTVLLLAGGFSLWQLPAVRQAWQALPNEQVAPTRSLAPSPPAETTQPLPTTPTAATASASATVAAPTLPTAQMPTPAIATLDAVSRTIWLQAGREALVEGQAEIAKGNFERILAVNPQDMEALVGLARALRALAHMNEALRTFKTAEAISPTDPNVNLYLGLLYYEEFNEYPLALEHLTRAIAHGTPEVKRDSHINRAIIYAKLGQYANAVTEMNEVITTNSNSDDFVRRAQIYQAWGNEKMAERDFTEAIQRAPSTGKNYFYRAEFYVAFNRVQEAVVDYDSFLRLREPDEDQGVINKAEDYIRFHSRTPAVTATLVPTLTARALMTNPVDGAVYVYVPAGTFIMGLDEGGFDAKPQHEVYLAAFWIMQTEVTNEQYEKCVEADVCTLPFNPEWGTDEFWAKYDKHPVTQVTWKQAMTYAEWAGGRLPTEAEWEKAARGTDERLYPWGSARPTERRLNFDNHIGDTQPVGSYPDSASPYGALDMAGNVWEWVADWYDPEYYQVSPSENPTGPLDGERRVLRGGAYGHHSTAYYVASYYREGAITGRAEDYGFRVVQEEAPK